MVAVVVISDGHDLRIEACHRNQPSKSILSLYKLLFSLQHSFKWLYTSNKMEHFSYKGGCDGYGSVHIEVFKRRAGLGYR